MLNVGDKLICKTEGQPETEFCIRGEVKKVEGDIVTISRALKFGTLPMHKDLTLPESELLKYYTPLDNQATDDCPVIGYITSVTRDDTDSVLTVDFGDGRIAEYDGSDLEMLDLAYASTIHKSQGSEYKSVIINLQCAHAVMLVRPLVYTAITRAKERVLIVGERRALCIAIKRTDTEQRGTMLSARIKELISNVKGDHYNGNLAQ